VPVYTPASGYIPYFWAVGSPYCQLGVVPNFFFVLLHDAGFGSPVVIPFACEPAFARPPRALVDVATSQGGRVLLQVALADKSSRDNAVCSMHVRLGAINSMLPLSV
jgi:hypothetical protein